MAKEIEIKLEQSSKTSSGMNKESIIQQLILNAESYRCRVRPGDNIRVNVYADKGISYQLSMEFNLAEIISYHDY
jgi:hypothetical protein